MQEWVRVVHQLVQLAVVDEHKNGPDCSVVCLFCSVAFHALRCLTCELGTIIPTLQMSKWRGQRGGWWNYDLNPGSLTLKGFQL